MVDQLKQLDSFSVIEVLKSYTQGFGLIIEVFKVLCNPGHLIVSDNITKLFFLDINFFEKLANKSGATDQNGEKDSEHPFFKTRTPIVPRKTRSKSDKTEKIENDRPRKTL